MQGFCCFIVFLCQYIHSFIFPEMAGGGGATAPLATPLNPPLDTSLKIPHSCMVLITCIVAIKYVASYLLLYACS